MSDTIAHPSLSDKAKGLGRVVSKSLHAAKSVVKTQVLRKDRVTPEAFELRLAVCQNCPDGHATYNKDGSLHTCGPMLQSLKDEGRKTCGCVLKAKARDAKETCPFNHWPTPTPQQTELEALPLTVLNAKVENIELSEENQQKLDEMMSELRKRHGRLLGPDGTPYAIPATKNSEARTSGASGGGLWTPSGDVSLVDPGRRRFLGAAAVMAGALIAPGYLWARNPEELCYFEVKNCEDATSKWVRCDVVQGHKVGDTFKNGGTGGDGKCYEVKANHNAQPQGEELDIGIIDWEDDCSPQCGCECGDCSFSEGSMITGTIVRKHCYYPYQGDCTGEINGASTNYETVNLSFAPGSCSNGHPTWAGTSTQEIYIHPDDCVGPGEILDVIENDNERFRYNCSTSSWQRRHGSSWDPVDFTKPYYLFTRTESCLGISVGGELCTGWGEDSVYRQESGTWTVSGNPSP